MKWYNDQVVWYITPSEKVFTFFDRVYCGSLRFDYDTLQGFFNTNSGTYWSVSTYNVEPLEGNRIVLSVDLTGVTIRPTSIALADSSGNLLCKIILSTEHTISTTILRVFNIELPYEEIGGVRVYPSFIPVTVKRSTTPIGGENVLVDEHRHSAINQATREVDNFPNMSTAIRNFNLSTQTSCFSLNDGGSYLFGETGTLQEVHSDMTGQRSRGNTFLSGMRDRNISNPDVLTAILEVIIMSNNRIQILGKSIPVVNYVTTSGNGGTGDVKRSGENTYFLVSDKTGSGNDRNLYAIKYNDFAKFLVSNTTSSSNSAVVDTSVSVVTFSTRGSKTITFHTAPAIAIVKNGVSATNVTNAQWNEGEDSNRITVGGVSIPPQGTAVLFYDGSSTTGFHVGEDVECLVESLAKGVYQVSELDFGGGNTISTAGVKLGNITLNSTDGLKIGNSVHLSSTGLSGVSSVVVTNGPTLNSNGISNAKAITGATTITASGTGTFGTIKVDNVTIDNNQITGLTGISTGNVTVNGGPVISNTGIDMNGGDITKAGNISAESISGGMNVWIEELRIGPNSGNYISITAPNGSSGRLKVSTGVDAPQGFYVQ